MGDLPVFMWREILFPLPLSEHAALEAMRRLADDSTEPPIILEARATSDRTQFLVGCDATALPRVTAALGVSVADEIPERVEVFTSKRLGLSTDRRGFAVSDLQISASTILAALHRVHKGELLVIQLAVGKRYRAHPVPAQTTARQSVLALLNGTPARALDGNEHQALSVKYQQPGFKAHLQLGVTAGTSQRRQVLTLGLFAALRRLETPGMKLTLLPGSAKRFADPLGSFRGGLRLSLREAAAMLPLPVSDGNHQLAGLPSLHPKPLAPLKALPVVDQERIVVGVPTAPGIGGELSLSTPAILRGVHVFGPPGVGKSSLLSNLLVQWCNQGRGAIVLEPKTDLAQFVTQLDEKAQQRVVYVDLTDEEAVIGFNPMRLHGRSPEIVADSILEVFSAILSDVLGIRSRDVVYSAVLSLLHYPNSTLLMLPPLLTDAAFRRKVTAQVAHDPFLQSFWAWYDGQSEKSQQQLVSPVLSRLRQILLRKSLRYALGQAEPTFDISQVFNQEKKILVLPLPEAQLGSVGSALLGSLVLHDVFAAVKNRATVEQKHRHPVMIVVDEVQTYVDGMADEFREALAIFRGYGAGLMLANQVLVQLPADLRAVILGTARSRIYFQTSPEDAKTLAAHIPELAPEDLASLDEFHVYASLFEGKNQPFISGKTLPPFATTTTVEAAKALSRHTYGTPVADIEAEIAAITGTPNIATEGSQTATTNPASIGRRKRTTP